MQKQTQVVLLPTKESRLALMEGKLQYILDESDSWLLNKYHVPQHLYFLEEGEIIEGDWYMWLNNKAICKAEVSLDLLNRHVQHGDVRKIIASTDPSLNLPTCSQTFLQRYVEKRNAGKPLEKVMVEYTSEKHLHEQGWMNELKLRGNEIIIHALKDSFTREEVLDIAVRVAHYGFGGTGRLDTIEQWFNSKY